MTRRDLLHEVWGYNDDVVSRTVDTHMAELRRKLGHHAGEPGHIATVARVGYRPRGLAERRLLAGQRRVVTSSTPPRFPWPYFVSASQER